MEEETRYNAIERGIRIGQLVREAVVESNRKACRSRFPARRRQNLGISVDPCELSVWVRLTPQDRESPGSTTEVKHAHPLGDFRLVDQPSLEGLITHANGNDRVVEWCQETKPQSVHVVHYKSPGLITSPRNGHQELREAPEACNRLTRDTTR